MWDLREWLIVVTLTVMLLIGAAVVIDAARKHAAAPCEAPDTGWEPPDVRLCPKGMELWDCVRDAMWRKGMEKRTDI